MTPRQWPMLFSKPMVLATLAGRKTVTRRLDLRWLKAKPGEVLWGRETHAKVAVGNGRGETPWCVAYRATCDHDGGFDYNTGTGFTRLKVAKWTPSIFMPRWASRIVTPIVSVRAEQLHDITEEDARAEGMYHASSGGWLPEKIEGGTMLSLRTARDAFAYLWDQINGKRAPWSSNPTVAVVTFKPLEVK